MSFIRKLVLLNTHHSYECFYLCTTKKTNVNHIYLNTCTYTKCIQYLCKNKHRHIPMPNVNHTQTCLHSNTDKNTLNCLWSFILKKLWLCLKKKEVLLLLLLLPWTTEQQYWQYAEDLETEDSTMPDSDLYLHRNTCSLTALALSPSALLPFILFSEKIIST